MPRETRTRRRRPARTATHALVAMLVLALLSSTAATTSGPVRAMQPPAAAPPATRWVLPVPEAEVVSPYRAPAHRYAPGHRGIDLAAPVGTPVRAPAAGVVAFSGTVANRGVVTIDHGDGLVSTLEPVAGATSAGLPVAASGIVGTVATGGHAAAGTLHLGARRDGEYLNPLSLIGELPWAVLLPCC